MTLSAERPKTPVETPVETPVVERLLRSAARQSYDPEVDIDWSAPPVPGLWWMRPERMSLYGTPLWDRLSEEQRIELSKHEIGSMVSVGLWFEILLMELLLRDVYRSDPREARTHFALTEVADECRHTTMFGKALALLDVPAYGPRPAIDRLGRLAPVVGRGPGGYGMILLGEEPVDRLQREMMADERIQPLARQVARIHVVEEARHVTFARHELARSVRRLGRAERLWHQTVVAQAAYVMMRSLVHPDVYAVVGIDPAEGRRTALANPHYRATLGWMGEKVVPFLREHGLVPDSGPNARAWRASFLVA